MIKKIIFIITSLLIISCGSQRKVVTKKPTSTKPTTTKSVVKTQNPKPKFPGLECQHHQAIEKKARARWLVGDLVCTPQHVFCDPQGNVVHRKVYLVSKATLAKCLLLTLEASGVETAGLKVDFGKAGDDALPDAERANVNTWLADLDSRNLEVREAALRGLGAADDPRALPADC